MDRTLSTIQKSLLTDELWRAGIALMEQNFRRKHADSPEEAAKDYRNWLLKKSDRIPGDVDGDVRVRYRAP
ncbi:MAG: hypothetical protein ACO3ZG_10805 [Kiritimatiellia bacterium]|jgi:hypothetical protein